MNDNELITRVRDSVADVHTTTPVAQIISRGRAVRAVRQIPPRPERSRSQRESPWP